MQEFPNSNVRGLFTHRATDKRHFGRILEITQCYIRNGQLLLQMHIDGSTPPLPWLKTLSFIVKDDAGRLAGAKIKEVKRDNDGFVIVATEPLTAAVDEEARLTAGPSISILSSSGMRLSQPLGAVLKTAKP